VTISRHHDQATARHRVLVVEDDQELGDVIADALQHANYAVSRAADGRQALDQLARGPTPCLVLTDVMMPIMSGLDLRERMLADARLRGVPLVIMTAGGVALEAVLRELGTVMLRKPLSMRTLLDTVARHCGGSSCRARRHRQRGDASAQTRGARSDPHEAREPDRL
jgi:DNA-binding response OmpR family regulator